MHESIEQAHEEWPFAAANEDAERIKAHMGWHWPSRATIYNRWDDLPQTTRLTLRHGAEKAMKMIRQPVLRDRSTVAPLHIWSLDGQTKNILIEFEEPTKGRALELRPADVGSGKPVGRRVCKTENAIDTAALILDAVRRYGAPKYVQIWPSSAIWRRQAMWCRWRDRSSPRSASPARSRAKPRKVWTGCKT